MLIPAILKKFEIEQEMKKLYYTNDMMLVSGELSNWLPDIVEEPDGGIYQYAVVDKGDNLIGLIVFHIDWYNSMAHRFGIVSFDKNNPILGNDLHTVIKKLLNEYKLHRIEWSMICGNPVEKHYDRFAKRYNGRKIILRDVIKDRQGNYHDSIIYEIIRGDNKC